MLIEKMRKVRMDLYVYRMDRESFNESNGKDEWG